MAVAQHPFGHELGGTIGRDRLDRRILEHRLVAGIAIDSGGRGKDEARHLMLDRSSDEGARFDRVVEIIGEWIGNRVRHHDRAGEMNDRIEIMGVHHPVDERAIADIAFDQRGLGRDRPPEAG